RALWVRISFHPFSIFLATASGSSFSLLAIRLANFSRSFASIRSPLSENRTFPSLSKTCTAARWSRPFTGTWKSILNGFACPTLSPHSEADGFCLMATVAAADGLATFQVTAVTILAVLVGTAQEFGQHVCSQWRRVAGVPSLQPLKDNLVPEGQVAGQPAG